MTDESRKNRQRTKKIIGTWIEGLREGKSDVSAYAVMAGLTIWIFPQDFHRFSL